MKTRDEVEQLKQEWMKDPCWDLEDTEGYEEYREELEAFHNKKKEEWHAIYVAKSLELSDKYGIPGNQILARKIEQLETKLEKLERRISLIDSRCFCDE